MSQPRETGRLPFRVDSSEQIIAIQTLTPYLKSRMIGGILVNWHMRNGTWQQFKPAATDVMSAIAHQLGVASDYSVGLVFEDENARERIAECAVMSITSTYQTFIQLIKLGAMRGQGTRFELIMPPEPWDWDPAKELSPGKKNLLPNENEAPRRAPTTEILFPNRNSEGVRPLQNQNLRAPTTEILFPNRNSVPQHNDAAGRKNIKSDSHVAGWENSLGNQNVAPAIALKLLKLRAIKALSLTAGKSIAEILIEAGGFRAPQAFALAKKKNATLEWVAGAILLCDEAEASGKLATSREQFITAKVTNRWRVPLEQDLVLQGRSEHEAEMDAFAIEAERSNSPASKSGEAITPPPPPVPNENLQSLVAGLTLSQPDAQRDAEASRKSAESARLQMLAAWRRGLKR